MQEAKWFIKSLESRNDTLLKVSNCIVQRQQGFFEHGPEAMRPMVLNDIAEAVDMHESTISRVTTQNICTHHEAYLSLNTSFQAMLVLKMAANVHQPLFVN